MNRLLGTTLVFLMTSCVFAGQEEETAWQHLQHKNYSQALDLFSTLSLYDPENIHLKIGIARANQGLGKLTEAERLFRQLSLQDKRRCQHKSTGVFCRHLQTEFGLARCLEATGNAEKLTEAERLFRQLRRQLRRREGLR